MDEKDTSLGSDYPVDVKEGVSNKNGAASWPEIQFTPIFKNEKTYHPSDDEIDELAKFMTSRDGLADSNVPAGYTYLSQFITHDISLDSALRVAPWNKLNAPKNKRTPFLDLETIYGSENPKPGEMCRSALLKGLSRLKLDKTLADGTSGVTMQFPNDLPREKYSSKPIIVDERNDENLAVAQTQVAFMKFHNAVVDFIGGSDTEATFEEARRIVTQHYQWIVLDDFLPRIVKVPILEDVLRNRNKFYLPDQQNPGMPIEFSFAALRIGHSMIRDSYQWNRVFNNDPEKSLASLDRLSEATHMGGGFTENLPSIWLINWRWFYDIDDSKNTERNRFNFSRRIDTYITPTLGRLRGRPIDGYRRDNSLPALDLYRSRALGIPSGQSVAKDIQDKTGAVQILTPDEIAQVLPSHLQDAFSTETPLMFYLLAEAELEARKSGRAGSLGDVGSYILAETFVELLKLSPHSILSDRRARGECLGQGKRFGMAEMLKFNALINREFDELNPIGT